MNGPKPTREEFVRRLRRWGRANRRVFPWRNEIDPFRILIAELMLQRSRAITVARVYQRLFERWPDAKALARAPVRSIQSVIKPLGLVNRARTIKQLAQAIEARGELPRSDAELMDLPGVGRYVANATVAVAFNARAPVVDGVTARVYRRYFGLNDSKQPVSDRALWEVVDVVTPARAVREWNWAVLDLAALVCLPKVPRCEVCPLATSCTFASD